MRVLVELRVFLVTARIIFEHGHVVGGRVSGVVRRDVVLGLNVAEAEPCWRQTRDRVVEMGDAEVAARGGVLDVRGDAFEADFGGAVGVLFAYTLAFWFCVHPIRIE